MNPAIGAVAVAVLAGAVIAVSVRDGRIAVVGLVTMLVFAPIVSDPIGSPLALAARLAGAILAAYLLWIAVRGGGTTLGSRIGWPAEALLAVGAFVVGLGTHGLGATALGPVEAQAAIKAKKAAVSLVIAHPRYSVKAPLGRATLEKLAEDLS